MRRVFAIRESRFDPRAPRNSTGRRALLPARDIPLLYFGFAHVCFALALMVLLVRPDLPGGFFHHPG